MMTDDTATPYIMYVDDSEDDIFMAQRAFKKSCLATKIITLSDGQECLDYLFSEGEYANEPHNLPLVILLDLNMPRVGGLEVLERLRANQKTKRIPVVVLTTSDADSDIDTAYDLGANSFITKPMQTEDFFKTIQEMELYWTVHNKKPSY